MQVTADIRYIGVHDHDIDLFEGQYQVPRGISYNSYVILDDKVCVMDTTDRRKAEDYLKNLAEALGGRKPDYLVVSHVEPDHASSLQLFLDAYPETVIVGNAKTFQLLDNYFMLGSANKLTVKEGETLSLGRHTLKFLIAPMVHWPEVMLTWDECDRVLFSADAFGQFGAVDLAHEWEDDEARRYYFNIVGKYGPQVQTVLKKAAGLDIALIAPLHGPVLAGEAIAHAVEKYQTWSTYAVESEGVLVAWASLHGNTAAAAERLADILDQKGCPEIMTCDLARDDGSEALAQAFRYGKVVLAASTYNAGLMPYMDDFLRHLAAKNWQKRTVGLIENGSWAPMAGKVMREALGGMKEITVLEPAVTLKGAPKTSDLAALEALADRLMEK
ncbi:MAG: FprA family A-type flavoprotein [Clostridia bacterium]|nr:FprA family A-type flavoprotein [Clostridia bacterium]